LRLLLDTNVVIWWLEDSDRLGPAARNAIDDGIKSLLGKLRTPTDLEQQISKNSFMALPITVEHGVAVQELPLHGS
jgi:PIN domain nuclease of toxin-antitoxin system